MDIIKISTAQVRKSRFRKSVMLIKVRHKIVKQISITLPGEIKNNSLGTIPVLLKIPYNGDKKSTSSYKYGLRSYLFVKFSLIKC